MGGKRLRRRHWGSDMLKTTPGEDKDFTSFVLELHLVGESIPLSKVMEWIAERYNPEDVFPVSALLRWGEDRGFCST